MGHNLCMRIFFFSLVDSSVGLIIFLCLQIKVIQRFVQKNAYAKKGLKNTIKKKRYFI